VLLNGKRIDGKKPFEVNRLGLSRSFQITNIFGRLSVFENLRCACSGAWATATPSCASSRGWTT
jgi:ABC-type branched-subunit amino acid transport system ATPase component